MKTASAISKFMAEGNYSRVKMNELKEFKASCTPEEWKEFGKQAADLLGETFEE